jgi:hypothetical protein
MNPVKYALLRYLNEHFDDLLELDLALARLSGAPAPHTISSYAAELERDGKLLGLVTRPAIDGLFYWLIDEPNHCKKDYERVTNGTRQKDFLGPASSHKRKK